jgi:hypothetical protein
VENDHSGVYKAQINPQLQLVGNSNSETINVLQVKDNLIPTDIYLKVDSDGSLYNTS